MQQEACIHGGVSRRGFLNLTCGCALAVTSFGKAYANTDPIRVAQASGSASGGKGRAAYLGHSVFRIDTPSGKTIYIDPWLGNPKAPANAKQVDKPISSYSATDTLITWGRQLRSPRRRTPASSPLSS